jgi:mono/diheme cytochrome c family protein/glucose/arabinose dehydrogenase
MLTQQNFAQMGDHEGEVQQDLPHHVMHMESPVLTPEQAIDSFVLQDGFHIELVASEPMIEDPVAAVFAPDGSLWVIEMQSFMPDVDGNNELQPISRVVHLTDTNGDGVMDNSVVFLDNVVLPRAIALSHDGVLLVAPPNLLYCRDLDGDGKCDDTKILTGGFGGLDSIEHAGNGMIFGLDNTFHNSQHPYSFQFDGETLTSISVPSHGQWGTTQDDYGRQYYAPNSYPVLIDDLPKHYAKKNGKSRTIDGLYRGIATDKRVWPVHATPGVNRGYQEGRLTDEYKLTKYDSACGPAVYRDTLLGDNFEGDVFVCETVGNLVSRFAIEEDGNGSIRAVPAYEQAEFLASTDERFRPVNIVNGPDGALYIVDMYRGIIQHRMFVTSFLRKQIKARGLETPLGLGRIWRVVPDNNPTRVIPNLSTLTQLELVSYIQHSNGSVRDMAQRLLVESTKPQPEVISVLEKIAATAELDRDRIKALWTLRGMGRLSKKLVVSSLKDSHPIVRTHAIRLSEPWINEKSIFRKVTALAADPNVFVKRQVALTVGLNETPEATFFLLSQLGKVDQKKYRSAATASLMGKEAEALELLGSSSTFSQDTLLARKTLQSIVNLLLAEKNTDTNTMIIEFATNHQTQYPWKTEVAMDRVSAFFRGKQCKLSKEPTSFEALQKTYPSLTSQLWWPGRDNVAEYKPKQVDQRSAKLIARGKQVYNICKVCHQVNGLGQFPTYPSLVNTSYVTGDATVLIKIMLHGLDGPITVDGENYDGSMPPITVKNDRDIAAVISYIRQAWGNEADVVYPSEVSAVRMQYEGRKSMWSAEELLN